MAVSVAVLGAGVVGLTTADHVQNLLPHAQVTIIADKFSPDTTSDGAAGLFYPTAHFQGPTPSSAKEWMIYSYKYYERWLHEDCGIYETYGYILSSQSEEEVQNELMVGVAPEYRPMTTKELQQFPGGQWKYGTFARTLIIRCNSFLPWLLNRIKSRGGRVVRRTVQDLQELSGQYDVVVNCSGLRARWLCHDVKVTAIRGQILKVKAPSVDHFLFADGADTYIIPHDDGIVSLGGTCQYNVWDDRLRTHDAVGIRQRCAAVVPVLASAPVAWEWVGLRPYRGPVRVEPEIKPGLKIVHNYGHGGYGVTSAPGSARDAASLVMQILGAQPKL